MRSVTRLFAGSMAVAVAAMVVMLAAPAARAHTGTRVLVFAVQPTTTQMGTAMTPTVVVDVEDSQGHLVTSYDEPVTLTYAVNPVGAAPPENNVVEAVGGVATFPDLIFSAVGFGFELKASAQGATTSSPSQPFDIVDQLLHCQPGQACQSETVSSQGTSGSAVASQAPTSDVLTATGGGFPDLSCTSIGGIVSFTVTNRSKTITMMLAKSLVQQAPNPGAAHFNICWGSPTAFTTKDGTTSAFNVANDEYEGLLPDCSASGPSPCAASRHKTKAGVEVITVSAPRGDPHSSF
jgi:hypothetical protein